MCKHIVNAQVAMIKQVSVRSPCCKKWFDCPECHNETEKHELRRTLEMIFACKSCKKTFRKDMKDYEEQDEFCPHCDNHYVIEAKAPELNYQIQEQIMQDLRQKEIQYISDDLMSDRLG